MAEPSIEELAGQAMRRMVGDKDSLSINAGNPRYRNYADEIEVSSDPMGESHKAYARMMEEKKTAEAKAAALSKQQAQLQAKSDAEKAQAAKLSLAQSQSQAKYGADYKGGAYELPNYAKARSYGEYFKGNNLAQQHAYYLGSGTNIGENLKWGSSGNPYRFRNEYNKYLGDIARKQRDFLKETGQIMTYDQYWAGDQDAQKYKGYRSGGTDGVYRFNNEYSKYLSTFPKENVERFVALQNAGQLPSGWL